MEYPRAVFDADSEPLYFSKKGQPYVLGEKGRPRFIKNSDPRTKIFRDIRYLSKHHPEEVPNFYSERVLLKKKS